MLKVWFPGTTDLQDQGLGGTEWINDNVTIVDSGKLGKCLSFNGSSSKLSTTNFELDNTWSFACWAKDDASVTNWRLLIMLNTTGSDADTQMSFWLHTGEHRFEVCANGKYISTVQYVPSQWNHFAATYNGSQLLVYLNGAKVYTLANTNAKLERHNLTIGARGTNANGGHAGATSYFYGLVNDLRIWDNEVLSPREIKEIAKGLVLHYPLSMPGQDNILTNTKSFITTSGGNGLTTDTYNGFIIRHLSPRSGSGLRELAYYNNFVKVVSEGVYTQSFWAKGSGKLRCHLYGGNIPVARNITSQGVSTTSSDGNCEITLSPEWKRYWVTHTLKSSSDTPTNKHILLRVMDGDNDVYVCGWKLEEGSIATPWIPNSADPEYAALGLNDEIEYDVSGYKYNGTKNGSFSYSSDTPRYNTSTFFNGTEWIKTNTPNAEILTLSCWAKTTKNKSTSQFMIADSTSGLCISFYNGTIISYFGANENKGTGSKCTLGSAYKENDWNHFVVIKTGIGTRKVYCNGIEQVATSNDYWGAASGFFVGSRNNSATTPFYGQISDVRAYATALTEEEILELYRVGASLSNNGALMAYEFNE